MEYLKSSWKTVVGQNQGSTQPSVTETVIFTN